jgi:hypothetical protein
VISVQAIVLPSNLANPKESQPAEITQLLFQSASNAQSAVRAVLKCNPLRVPPKYAPYFEQWRTKTIHFDPQSAMAGSTAASSLVLIDGDPLGSSDVLVILAPEFPTSKFCRTQPVHLAYIAGTNWARVTFWDKDVCLHRKESDQYSVILTESDGNWRVVCNDQRGDLPEYDYYAKLCAGMPREAYRELFGLKAPATTTAAAPQTAPTIQQTSTPVSPLALADSTAAKTTGTAQRGLQMLKPFSMVDLFGWLTHIVLLLAALGMLVLVLAMILGIGRNRPVEAIMRAVACACGLLLYISSKAVGFSLPDLVFNALSTSFPWKVGVAGFLAPSCLGFLSAWYVGRYLNSMDALKNVVGMRVLVLTMTFVFFLYCDSYVASFATDRRDDLRFLFPNVSFTIAVLLYAILRYHPGELLTGKNFRGE